MIKSRFLPLNVVASLILSWKVVEAWSKMLKHSSKQAMSGCLRGVCSVSNCWTWHQRIIWLLLQSTCGWINLLTLFWIFQDFRKGKTWKIIWQFFCLVVCVFRKLKPWDPVVRTHVTPFLINSLKIWHLTRKSSSGVKSSLCKFAWKNFLIHQEHAPKLVSSTSLWMILQFIG